jgi:hypothetical protein
MSWIAVDNTSTISGFQDFRISGFEESRVSASSRKEELR